MAKITDRIAGYAEMSAEDKLKALEALEEADSSAELERMKNAVSKANSEAAAWKKKHNELLTEDERKKQEDADALADMKKELDELRRLSERKALASEQQINDLKDRLRLQQTEQARAMEGLKDVTQLRAEAQALREKLQLREKELMSERQQNEAMRQQQAFKQQTLMTRLAALESPSIGTTQSLETNQSREAKLVKLPSWMRIHK